MAWKASKSFSLSSSSQKQLFFAVLMYFLYDHPRYFKLKWKYQQYHPCPQTIFPLLMTILFLLNNQWWILLFSIRYFLKESFAQSIHNNLVLSNLNKVHKTFSLKKLKFKYLPLNVKQVICELFQVKPLSKVWHRSFSSSENLLYESF